MADRGHRGRLPRLMGSRAGVLAIGLWAVGLTASTVPLSPRFRCYLYELGEHDTARSPARPSGPGEPTSGSQ